MASTKDICQPAAGSYELTEQLLARAHIDYNVNYQGLLANHLPHGLYTLCALGASTSRLQEFHDMYVKRLEPLSESKTIIDSTNWATNIGNKDLYSDYLRFFDSEVSSKGLQETFQQYFRELMGESLGAALHPLINVGYAMEFNNPILLSEGLAYICISPLQNTSKVLSSDNDCSRANASTTIFDLIEELRTIQLPKLNDIFPEKVEDLLEAHGPVFKELVDKWDLSQDDQLPAKLNELTEASILGVFGTYPNEIDFFLLHGLTGNHAVRVIFPHLSTALQRQILKVNLLGFLVDYAVQQYPKIDVFLATGYKYKEPEENLSWDSILKRTISNDEEHVLKVVRSLIHYMEAVPLSQRPKIFTNTFLKQCAFKIVDLVQELQNYKF